MPFARLAPLLLVIGLALASCARIDADEARLCRAVVPTLQPSDTIYRVGEPQPVANAPHAVRLPYTAVAVDHEEHRHHVTCSFEPREAPDSPPRLHAVETDEAVLNWAQIYFLQRFWLDKPEALIEGETRLLREARAFPPTWVAYFAQAVVNGAPQSAILALLATAYSLLYGLVGRINLAFGDIAVTGAYGAAAIIGAALALGGTEAMTLIAALLGAVLLSSLTALVLGETVVAPLAHQPGRMLLVATIGVELVIQEGMRVIRGTRGEWIAPVLGDPHILFVGGTYPVHATTMQMVMAATAACLALATLIVMRRSRFGRAWRAIADDAKAAQLCGIDPHAVLVGAMTLAGGLAGACGAIMIFGYGNTHYAFGTVIGLKAIIAAILGGIGSVEGALLGGLALGLVEAFWSAYLPIEFKDMAVFCLLSLILVLRPGGLFGLADGRPRQV